MMGYIVSEDAIKLIKIFESLRLDAYLCPAGKWTIGYGHTGTDVVGGMSISIERAEEILQYDVNKTASLVGALLKTPLSPNQFGALVCFVFNVGIGNFKSSTLLKKINSGDLKGAGDEFLKWDKARVAGELVSLKGLTRRRISERTLFLRGVA